MRVTDNLHRGPRADASCGQAPRSLVVLPWARSVDRTRWRKRWPTKIFLPTSPNG
jgi:hypothetical protein